MSKDKTEDDYEVGYGKPPKDTQFQEASLETQKVVPKSVETSTRN
jgi:hypothetical protein